MKHVSSEMVLSDGHWWEIKVHFYRFIHMPFPLDFLASNLSFSLLPSFWTTGQAICHCSKVHIYQVPPYFRPLTPPHLGNHQGLYSQFCQLRGFPFTTALQGHSSGMGAVRAEVAHLCNWSPSTEQPHLWMRPENSPLLWISERCQWNKG